MTRGKIVVVEDEKDIREVIEHNLSREGYLVYSSSDGAEGLRMVRSESPNLVLLDLMLPGIDGLDICRELKADSRMRSIPIIMVTAKGEESDVVMGLGIGADDYVVKPFSPRELTARVKAVLRRGQVRGDVVDQERIVRGEIAIDIGRHQVRIEGNTTIFTTTEMRLLHFLASRPGRVFSRARLLKRVMGEDSSIIDRNIDVHVRAIRKKLGVHRDLIETIRGVGYRFRDEGE